jgi:hypothetical protein
VRKSKLERSPSRRSPRPTSAADTPRRAQPRLGERGGHAHGRTRTPSACAPEPHELRGRDVALVRHVVGAAARRVERRRAHDRVGDVGRMDDRERGLPSADRPAGCRGGAGARCAARTGGRGGRRSRPAGARSPTRGRRRARPAPSPPIRASSARSARRPGSGASGASSSVGAPPR